MKIELICIEKTKKTRYKNIIQDYLKRINRKLDLTVNEITFANSKNKQEKSISTKQTNLIKRYINDKTIWFFSMRKVKVFHRLIFRNG